MSDRSEGPDRQRGRPRRDRQSQVPDELVRALRHVLAHKPAHEVSIREIAAVAGTSPEMVRYYFNGKDGLITALLDESLVRVKHRLDRLKRAVADAGAGHSRLIVVCLAALYLEEREAGKLFNSEFAKAQARHEAMGLVRRSDTIIEVLCQIIVDLVGRGVYRASLDPTRAAILIMSLTGCPVRLLDTLAPRWLDEDTLRDEGWANDMTCMVDRYCLA